ncbi:hypothetical protein NECAME_17166 [Necator americanus]|uniref:Uncharacterized protein n=1 Tax=Necator americanus TaxID=51031 RepID=W2TTE2_NECAM|nr:hypothetical protein NECAME_17166 [Necator americanus]ETN84317.1 hypothetical protein NECAME_17166 [Necator americanus]
MTTKTMGTRNSRGPPLYAGRGSQVGNHPCYTTARKSNSKEAVNVPWSVGPGISMQIERLLALN